MRRYVVRRTLITLPMLLAVTAIIFGLLQLVPGNPLDAFIPPGQYLPPAERAALAHALGLDRPLLVRYLFWLRNTAEGNLGFRITSFQPVTQAIAQHIGPTVLLMGTGMTIGICTGLLLGVVTAVKRGSIVDNILTVVTMAGISTPAFVIGLVGLYLFSVRVRWFPSGGFSTPGQPTSLIDVLYHLALPAILLSFGYAAIIMRYTRSAMLEVLTGDFIRTARAKGVQERSIILVHTFRNALLPLATVIGAQVPNVLGGAVFLETIFSWPGMGQLFYFGVQARDTNLIMGITLVVAIATLLANLATDIVYAIIDPRIRYQ